MPGAVPADSAQRDIQGAEQPIQVQAGSANPGIVNPGSANSGIANTASATAGSGLLATAQSQFGAAVLTQPPLAGQLSGPLFSLATARPGEHTMTLSVTPEDLGPVTIRAHIGAEGVRVELFAPNDSGREALRSILHELRRDLAAAGLGTDLNLSSRENPAENPAEERDGASPGATPSGEGPQGRTAANRHFLADQDTPPHLRYAGQPTGLDVLA